jgi:hypothetical protein
MPDMAVRLFLTSGGERMVPTADAARADGPFFLITRRHPTGRVDTVLTLRTEDVVAAEILENGAVVDYVLGGGQSNSENS